MTSLEVNSSGGWRFDVDAEVDMDGVASAGTATRQLLSEVPRNILISTEHLAESTLFIRL